MEDKFWQRVDKRGPDDCWEWTGCISSTSGYGYYHPGKNKKLAGHRMSWEIHFGAIPLGLLVCHHCDNRSCVNPAHLFLGTHKDNTQDMLNKGRGNRPKGEDHPRSKLTVKDVVDIRASQFGCRILAKKYQVSRPTIMGIRNRKYWKHIP